MRLIGTALPGVYVVEPDPTWDERGCFARTFDDAEFGARGLRTHFPQCSVSFNTLAGTLRGLHFQAAPHAEAKLVRCTAGAVFDVAADLRPDSPTYGQWVGVELNARDRRALYIPEGCAHGFQTLADASEVFYQISAGYAPDAARGVRWDDPALGIVWPDAPRRIISERDRAFPDLRF